jgi:hypothetical protein
LEFGKALKSTAYSRDCRVSVLFQIKQILELTRKKGKQDGIEGSGKAQMTD